MSGNLNESSGQPRRRSGCWWIVLAGVGTVALLVILVCGGFFLGEQRAGREVGRELGRLRAAGEPTTAEELDVFYARPPAEKDVTWLLLAAMAPLQRPEFTSDSKGLPIVGEDIPIPPPGQPWKEQPAVEKLLAKYAESLKSLHEAARRGGAARFPVKFQDGFNMLLPDTQSVRAAARLLALEAHVRAHRGDAHGAAESILAMVSAGESLRQEPIVVSQLVRLAVQGMASGTAEKLVSGAPFADADLARLQARFQGLNCDEGMLRALMGERAMGVQAIRDPGANLGGGAPPAPVAFLVAGDHAVQVYLDWMDQVIAAARQPLPGRLDQVAAVEAGIRESVGGAGPITRLRSMMPAQLLPALQAAMAAGARGNATAQVTATGIAAQRFRLKHGKLPARLEDLVPGFLPAVPMDPFDGKPLRWVVKGDELVVYSIGRNRIDEGGVGPAGGSEGDVVFILGKKGQRGQAP